MESLIDVHAGGLCDSILGKLTPVSLPNMLLWAFLEQYRREEIHNTYTTVSESSGCWRGAGCRFYSGGTLYYMYMEVNCGD